MSVSTAERKCPAVVTVLHSLLLKVMDLLPLPAPWRGRLKATLTVQWLSELLRFVVGGGTAVFTDCGCYFALLAVNCPVSPAKLLAFVAGSAAGFIINKLWTFKSLNLLRREIPRYALLYMTTCALNNAVNALALFCLSPLWLAFLLATACSTVANYLGQKFWVFRPLTAQELTS